MLMDASECESGNALLGPEETSLRVEVDVRDAERTDAGRDPRPAGDKADAGLYVAAAKSSKLIVSLFRTMDSMDRARSSKKF